MDYKRVLRLHFVNHLSGREIAESCGDNNSIKTGICGKSFWNKGFRKESRKTGKRTSFMDKNSDT